MSARDMWKMLHLLHIYGPSLTRAQVRKVGITCDPDTIDPLVDSGAVEAFPPNRPREEVKEYRLTNAARSILQTCLVANRGNVYVDVRVDEPSVFVVMPFSESWSRATYAQMIKPAVQDAGLKCIRGDSVVRTGDLTANILKELFVVGVVVADVSVPNANVFYELGLSHALGREAILLKQAGAALPADLAGAHYYEYGTSALNAGRKVLAKALKAWAKQNCAAQVKALKK